MSKSITITVTFDEEQLQRLMDVANFSHPKRPSRQVADFNRAELTALKKELQRTSGNFAEEIIDGSREACANGWLSEWGPN